MQIGHVDAYKRDGIAGIHRDDRISSDLLGIGQNTGKISVPHILELNDIVSSSSRLETRHGVVAKPRLKDEHVMTRSGVQDVVHTRSSNNFSGVCYTNDRDLCIDGC